MPVTKVLGQYIKCTNFDFLNYYPKKKTVTKWLPHYELGELASLFLSSWY